MTISYNWLNEYLPNDGSGKIDPGKLSAILTSIGLEVESMHHYEEVKGGLQGLIAGEVLTCEKHPDADKLKLTTVNVGGEKPLNIVCGAANVAAGQKVIVAPVGATIYPVSGDPIKLKKAKIRGAESEGMICAEDEIGLGNSHAGIMVLPPATEPGTAIAAIFKPYEDIIYEIGLTPNRMDAMSHIGVAKDVTAWLSYHHKKELSPVLPYGGAITADATTAGFEVIIENKEACRRYCGIHITGIKVEESPLWLKQRLKAIGLNPINNIVDITNYILHETGQPLHAFDADQVNGKKVIVKNVAEGTAFKTLDDKERKLSAEDLMICNADEPMCIAGVYGGIRSGVSTATKNIFLESAWFSPGSIRKTSLRHGLRTDAATRFEKGVDISYTAEVLKRAALLIKTIAGGNIAGELIDVYPNPLDKNRVAIKYFYLKKLSGKNYHPDDVKKILRNMGFEIVKEDLDELIIDVPYSKPDISIPADLVEEIMRIDGLDNVEIPGTITIAPAKEKDYRKTERREKIANYLVGLGFHEIFTNSITNSNFYTEEVLQQTVKMMNNLSVELDILRPQMIQGGLQVVNHNANRKNFDLRLFEFGKTYQAFGTGKYAETNQLSLYVTGNVNTTSWQSKAVKSDFFYLKGVVEQLLQSFGIKKVRFEAGDQSALINAATIVAAGKRIGYLGEVNAKTLKQFDIKNTVYYAEICWDELMAVSIAPIEYAEIPKFPSVTRDLALVVDKNVSYNQIEEIALSGKIGELKSVQLFDIFESDKLGAGKKSMAVSFMFLDESKTLTDKEIDNFMQKIISSYEEKISAEIRK